MTLTDPGGPTAEGGAPLRGYAGAVAALCLATMLAWAFEAIGLTETNLVLVYLLAVTAVAASFGRGPAIFASFGSVILFNFFFTSPHYTFRVHDSGYIFTFAVMLVIGLLVSALTARIRDQSIAASQRERRTEQLYELSQELSATTGHLQIATAAEKRLRSLLNRRLAIFVPDDGGSLRPAGTGSPELTLDPALSPAATWAYEHDRIAGAGTDTLPAAPALCLPLSTSEGVAGVIAIEAGGPDALLRADQRRLAETFAAQVSLALARDRLTEKIHRTIAEAENEKLRSAVLSSVSHDFRTPLTTIAGASSSLLDASEDIDPGERDELLRSIYGEADRLGRLVDNLLHMTRLESGQLAPQREWNIVEDLVGSSLTRIARQLRGRKVVTRIPGDLPMIRVDGVLIEIVLSNLLDNAAKYSPGGAPLEITARTSGETVLLEVADRGSGLTAEEKARAFEKFYRGPQARQNGSHGAGLGLAICTAIAKLHGGRLGVEDRSGGGTRFVLTLPLEEQPPAIELHDVGEAREGGRQ